MLEQKDLDALSIMMQNIVKNSEITILNKVDEKFAKFEEKVDEKFVSFEERIMRQVDEKFISFEERIMQQVDEKITKSEIFVLDEIERTRNILEKRIDKIEQDIDELKQYYRITKLEDSNVELLLKINDELSKRVEALEKKIA